MEQQYPYSTKWVKMFWYFFIFMELYPFSYYYKFTETLNLSNKKWKLVYLEKC